MFFPEKNGLNTQMHFRIKLKIKKERKVRRVKQVRQVHTVKLGYNKLSFNELPVITNR